jgi:hypothetical protein
VKRLRRLLRRLSWRVRWFGASLAIEFIALGRDLWAVVSPRLDPIRERFGLPARVVYEERLGTMGLWWFEAREEPVPPRRLRRWAVVCPDGELRQAEHFDDPGRARVGALYCSGGKPAGRRCAKFWSRWLLQSGLTSPCPGGRHVVRIVEKI